MINKEKIRDKIKAHCKLKPPKPHKSGNVPFDISTGVFFNSQTGSTVSAYNPKTELLEYVPTNWKLVTHIFLERKQFANREVFTAFRAFASVQWTTWWIEDAHWWNEESNLQRELNGNDKREQQRQLIGIPHSIEHSLTLEKLSKELKDKKGVKL